MAAIHGQMCLCWNTFFQSTEKKPCQTRILYPVNLLFRNKGEIKTSPDKGGSSPLALDLTYKKY